VGLARGARKKWLREKSLPDELLKFAAQPPPSPLKIETRQFPNFLIFGRVSRFD
jgi:hypothetical protein